MKKLSIFMLFFLVCKNLLISQVSVTTDGSAPDNSAMLDIKSTELGILIPRMTTTQRISISNPAEGLLVYDTDMGGFYYYHTGSWASVTSAVQGWSMTGNSGTDPAVNFIGTTDNTAFKIRVNNQLAGWIDPTLFANTGFGYRSLTGITTGLFNVATGNEALYSNTTGNANTSNGFAALNANTTGSNNTAVGGWALYSNTEGGNNTAIGLGALNSNTTGGDNTANGFQALLSNTTGNANTASGIRALYSNTTGHDNAANGFHTLYSNTEGSQNTASGFVALYSNTTGNGNTANGFGALYYNTEGSQNIAIGYRSLYSNTTGNFNIANGVNALYSNTTGWHNTATGMEALYSNTTGYYNTAYGTQALYSDTSGSYNTAAGFQALYSNTTGSNNTANGSGALYSNTTGNANIASGAGALYYNTEGFQNTAVGGWALNRNTTGSDNTANGRGALYSNTTGSQNTANGGQSLSLNTTGSNNTATGHDALASNTGGANNTAIGYYALHNNVMGSDNTSAGQHAGYFLTGGNNNIFLGSSSGPASDQSMDSSMWLGNTGENKPALYGDLTDGRIGIGTASPDPTARLEVNSDNQGFLPPCMTQEQISAISSPANGLIVFCTTDSKCYVFVAGADAWKEILYGSGTISPPPFSCGSSIIIRHVADAVAPVTKRVTYGTVDNIPGEVSKCWITSNLGADHQADSVNDPAEASAGWYWQFNRMQGYKHGGTTRTPNTTWEQPVTENSDWLAANDPCTLELGSSWRLPAITEWTNAVAGGGWTTWTGPWNSALKMHAAGFLGMNDGSLQQRDSWGGYWSSAQSNNSFGRNLGFLNGYCNVEENEKAYGFTIRCLRE